MLEILSHQMSSRRFKGELFFLLQCWVPISYLLLLPFLTIKRGNGRMFDSIPHYVSGSAASQVLCHLSVSIEPTSVCAHVHTHTRTWRLIFFSLNCLLVLCHQEWRVAHQVKGRGRPCVEMTQCVQSIGSGVGTWEGVIGSGPRRGH